MGMNFKSKIGITLVEKKKIRSGNDKKKVFSFIYNMPFFLRFDK
jgi:hypothetical protein